MKRTALTALFLLAVVFLLPVFLPKTSAGAPENSLDAILASAPAPAAASPSPEEPDPAEGTTLRLLTDGKVVTLPLEEYLFGVVAAEMPAAFQPEALKAQAVAARTYALYRINAGGVHDGADLCAESSCCKAWASNEALEEKWGAAAEEYSEKIRQAVSSTAGLALYCDGELIDAVFHSSSAGRTQSALEVWGREVPYLQSVPTYGEEASARFYGQAAFTPEEFSALLLAERPGADLSGGMEGWVSGLEYGPSGAVKRCLIGGEALTGPEVRRIFSLQSTRFDYSVSEGLAVFSTSGYGHGVGMSQYGANAMAAAGADFEEILEHYYTGASVEKITPPA